MTTIYFTLVAIGLYLVADRILDALERRAGRRFEQRSLVFFLLLLVLSLATFAVLRSFLAPG
jgi:hypothetical protein